MPLVVILYGLYMSVQIEKYARFITTNAEIQTRLTAAELDHASRCVTSFAYPLKDLSELE